LTIDTVLTNDTKQGQMLVAEAKPFRPRPKFWPRG